MNEKNIHKDTFNFEQYNKDKVKEVDEHNKKVFEKNMYIDKDIIEKESRKVGQYLKRSSIYINLEDKYEKIFGHN